MRPTGTGLPSYAQTTAATPASGAPYTATTRPAAATPASAPAAGGAGASAAAASPTPAAAASGVTGLFRSIFGGATPSAISLKQTEVEHGTAGQASYRIQLTAGTLARSNIEALPAYTLPERHRYGTEPTGPQRERALRLESVFEKIRAANSLPLVHEQLSASYSTPSSAFRSTRRPLFKIHYDGSIFDHGSVRFSERQKFHLTAYQDYDKAPVKYSRNTTRYRQVVAELSYFADTNGDVLSAPVSAVTSVQCAPKLGEPSEQIYLYVEGGKLSNAEAYKAVMREIFTNLLWAQEQEGVEVLVMPPIGGGIYLEYLEGAAEKARVRKLIHEALAEVIVAGNPQTGTAWKFEEIIYTLPNPPGQTAAATDSDYLAAVSSIRKVLSERGADRSASLVSTPLISVRNVEAVRAVERIACTGKKAGLVIPSSSKCIGGHYDDRFCYYSMEEPIFMVSNLGEIAGGSAAISATPYPLVLQTRINAANPGMTEFAWSQAKSKIASLSAIEAVPALAELTLRLKIALVNYLNALVVNSGSMDLDTNKVKVLIGQITRVYLWEQGASFRTELVKTRPFLVEFCRWAPVDTLPARHELRSFDPTAGLAAGGAGAHYAPPAPYSPYSGDVTGAGAYSASAAAYCAGVGREPYLPPPAVPSYAAASAYGSYTAGVGGAPSSHTPLVPLKVAPSAPPPAPVSYGATASAASAAASVAPSFPGYSAASTASIGYGTPVPPMYPSFSGTAAGAGAATAYGVHTPLASPLPPAAAAPPPPPSFDELVARFAAAQARWRREDAFPGSPTVSATAAAAIPATPISVASAFSVLSSSDAGLSSATSTSTATATSATSIAAPWAGLASAAEERREATRVQLQGEVRVALTDIINNHSLSHEKQRDDCVALFQQWVTSRRNDYFEHAKQYINGALVSTHPYSTVIKRAYTKAHASLLDTLRVRREAAADADDDPVHVTSSLGFR